MDIKKLTPLKWFFLIAATGVILLIFVSDIKMSVNERQQITNDITNDTVKMSADANSMREYEVLYEESLQKILKKVSGVGQVSVMVNIDSTEEVVLGTNSKTNQRNSDENDRQGGTRKVTELTDDKQIVVLRSNSSGEQPLIVKRLKPNIRGVIVVAEGANNVRTQALLVDAVKRALNVSVSKISILPMESIE